MVQSDSKFDWCLRDQHSLCRVKYQKFYFGPVGKGRKRRQGVIWLDEWVECPCTCHPSEDGAVKKQSKNKARRKS